MFKPVNNYVQAGQLNHAQACQQAKTICVILRVYPGIFSIPRKVVAPWDADEILAVYRQR